MRVVAAVLPTEAEEDSPAAPLAVVAFLVEVPPAVDTAADRLTVVDRPADIVAEAPPMVAGAVSRPRAAPPAGADPPCVAQRRGLGPRKDEASATLPQAFTASSAALAQALVDDPARVSVQDQAPRWPPPTPPSLTATGIPLAAEAPLPGRGRAFRPVDALRLAPPFIAEALQEMARGAAPVGADGGDGAAAVGDSAGVGEAMVGDSVGIPSGPGPRIGTTRGSTTTRIPRSTFTRTRRNWRI